MGAQRVAVVLASVLWGATALCFGSAVGAAVTTPGTPESPAVVVASLAPSVGQVPGAAVSSSGTPVGVPPVVPSTFAPVIGTPGACGPDTYVNVSGDCVHRPVVAPDAPPGATALCQDGSYSFSEHRSGTCSGRGGVRAWL